ncbi:MAG: hypothetical protein AAF449_09870 [Myxococcota bacterium]
MSEKPSAVTKILAALAVAHLSFVVVFVVTRLFSADMVWKTRALASYANLTGVFRDYSFFAPGVASGTRAAFVVRTDDDSAPEIVHLDSDSREIMFRLSCLVKSGRYDEKVEDLFAQSWATVMFNQRPRASSVTVMVQTQKLPSMQEYRAGRRPEWFHSYVAEFERRAEEERE